MTFGRFCTAVVCTVAAEVLAAIDVNGAAAESSAGGAGLIDKLVEVELIDEAQSSLIKCVKSDVAEDDATGECVTSSLDVRCVDCALTFPQSVAESVVLSFRCFFLSFSGIVAIVTSGLREVTGIALAAEEAFGMDGSIAGRAVNEAFFHKFTGICIRWAYSRLNHTISSWLGFMERTE
jgi:hypothetical protein